MGNSMSNAITPHAITQSFSSYGINFQGNSGRAQSLYQFGVAAQGTSFGDGHMASHLSVQPLEEASLGADRTVAELAIRQLTREIDHAKEELQDLEETLVHEMVAPPAREWLFPLMAIGLALSLYGSFSAANTAELGATGLMLLWSLSAFWFIYTRDKRFEMAKDANKAEIEIWSSRIEELQQSLEQNQRIVEPAGE
jgi:hypothetical protein